MKANWSWKEARVSKKAEEWRVRLAYLAWFRVMDLKYELSNFKGKLIVINLTSQVEVFMDTKLIEI